MKHDPTLPAYSRLRAFAADTRMSPLDRLTAGTAAAWLAHATCYGITAEDLLLQEIADATHHPVARAKTLTVSLIEALTAAGLPLTPPFQAIDVLYSTFDEDGHVTNVKEPVDPFEREMNRGPRL